MAATTTPKLPDKRKFHAARRAMETGPVGAQPDSGGAGARGGARAADAAVAIRNAVEMLSGHPLTGQRVDSAIREWVISCEKTGFNARYRLFFPSGG